MMREIMYNLNSILIISILFISLVIAIEAGYRIGRRFQSTQDDLSRSQVNAIQASLLGVLALLLGFTFSQSLQRYDSRSEALVDEANAIGTTYLRAKLLPASMRSEVQVLIGEYVDKRVQEATIPLSDVAARQVLLDESTQDQAEMWQYALLAAEEDKSPVTSGLFIQSLNELIDSYGKRNASLSRHVPEVALFLLFGTFVLTWGIVGFASGITGKRVSIVAHIMLVLIILLVFIIIDLDRPRRGLIEINQTNLIELQQSIDEDLANGDLPAEDLYPSP